MFDSILDLLNTDMSKEEIKQVINENNLNDSVENEINNLANLIKNGENKSKVFNNIKENVFVDSFCSLICDRISSKILPYEETTFIRLMSQQEYENMIAYAFNNMILTRKPQKVLLKELKLEVNQVICLIKFLNTITEIVIVNRDSIELFQDQMLQLFGFTDQEKNQFIWNLYDNHRKELNEIVIIDNSIRCKEIKQDTEFLISIFKNIFNENEKI